MDQSFKYIWRADNTEDKVANTIRKKYSPQLAVVDAAINQILRGIDDVALLTHPPYQQLDAARIFLITRSSFSLRLARQTLERGYYEQTLALIRMVMEDQLVANDAEGHPATLQALMEDEGMLGKGQLSLGKMAERVSPGARGVWADDYGTVSAFGAHPRPQSIRALTEVTTDGRLILSPHSFYDEIHVSIVLYYLLREVEQVMATTAKLTFSVGSEWLLEAQPISKEVNSLWRRIDEWTTEQREDSTDDIRQEA